MLVIYVSPIVKSDYLAQYHMILTWTSNQCTSQIFLHTTVLSVYHHNTQL